MVLTFGGAAGDEEGSIVVVVVVELCASAHCVPSNIKPAAVVTCVVRRPPLINDMQCKYRSKEYCKRRKCCERGKKRRKKKRKEHSAINT